MRKPNWTLILIAGLTLLSSCTDPVQEEYFFDNAQGLRQSSAVEQGVVPTAFVDLLPPSTHDIFTYQRSGDTLTYMKMMLAQLPEDYYALITSMKSALEKEVAALSIVHPEGLEWWSAEYVNRLFEEDRFVFRQMRTEDQQLVYIGAAKNGPVYAWIVQPVRE